MFICVNYLEQNYENKCTGVQNPRATITSSTETKTVKHTTQQTTKPIENKL